MIDKNTKLFRKLCRNNNLNIMCLFKPEMSSMVVGLGLCKTGCLKLGMFRCSCLWFV